MDHNAGHCDISPLFMPTESVLGPNRLTTNLASTWLLGISRQRSLLQRPLHRRRELRACFMESLEDRCTMIVMQAVGTMQTALNAILN